MGLLQNLPPVLLEARLSTKTIQERARKLMQSAGVEALGVANPPPWICLIAFVRGPLNVGGALHREVTERSIRAWADEPAAHKALFAAYSLGGEVSLNTMIHRTGKLPAPERLMRARISSAKKVRGELMSTKRYFARETKRLKAAIKELERKVRYYEREGVYAEIAKREERSSLAGHRHADSRPASGAGDGASAPEVP